MNLKTFISLCLLLAFAGGVGAQVPIPSRRVQTPGNNLPATARPPVGPPTPQATPTAPASPTGPPSPTVTKPLTATSPQKPISVTSTNDTDLDNDKADIVYDFPGVQVEQLLNQIYAPLVDRTLLMAGSGPEAIPLTATVTLKTESPLTRTEAIVALETVLGMNGISVVPIGDKFAKVIPSPSAGGAGGNFSLSTNLPLAGKFITQIVQVKYTSVEDLVQILKPFASTLPNTIIALPSTQTVILRDYAENVGRMLEMIKRIDILTPLSIKPEVIPIKYALASDIASALSALGASGGTSVGKSSSGATSFGGNGVGGGRNGFGNSGNGLNGGAGGYPGQPGQSTTGGGFGGLNSAATGARSSFQNNLQKIVSNAAGAGQFQLFGQTKIIADERTNSMLVFANDEDMKMIKTIISKLDVVLSQVLIDAIVMEINLTGTQSTGVSYLAQRQDAGSFSGSGGLNNLSSAASGFLTGSTASSNGVGNTTLPSGTTLANLPGGFSYFSKFGNDLNVVLEAVAGDSRVNVLSRPRIQTSHAVQADLFIGNTVPYITGTSSYYGSGPSSQYTQLEVGIHLQVTPLINPDGLVVMDIQADVEQLGPGVQIAGVGSVPTTTKRQAGAKVAVRDGETIILGGFISDSRTTSDTGIPWLKDIPGLGNLFKSKSFQNLRTELIMLMRPTVLPTPAAAALVATAERNKLSGVKQAELEIRQAEEDRNAAIEAKMAKDADKRAKELKKRRESDMYYYNTNNPSIKSIPPIEDAP